MQTNKITPASLLNALISATLETEIPNLQPYWEYTLEQIQKATYIQVNPDDCTWQLGYENIEELEFETLEEYLDSYLPESHLPIYIY